MKLIDDWKKSWKFWSSLAAILIGFLNTAIAANFFGLFDGWTATQVAALNAVLVGLVIPVLRALKQQADEAAGVPPEQPSGQGGFARPGLLMAVSASTIIALVGCASLGAPQPQTFKQRVLTAETQVTTVRKGAEILLKAGKLEADDAQNINDQADTAVAGMRVARRISATDQAAAQTRLTLSITILTELQTYLGSKEPKP